MIERAPRPMATMPDCTSSRIPKGSTTARKPASLSGLPVTSMVTASVQREILLVKVRTDIHSRSHVLETVQLFRAKVVDVASDTLTIEVTGNRDKLAAFLEVIEPFGVKELVQSGMVAIGRGTRSITDRAMRSA